MEDILHGGKRGIFINRGVHIGDIGGRAGNGHGPRAVGAAVNLHAGLALDGAFELFDAGAAPLINIRDLPLHPTQFAPQRPGIALLLQLGGVALDGEQGRQAVPVGAAGGDGFALLAAEGGGAEVGIGKREQAGGGGIGAPGRNQRAHRHAVAVGDDIHAGCQALEKCMQRVHAPEIKEPRKPALADAPPSCGQLPSSVT